MKERSLIELNSQIDKLIWMKRNKQKHAERKELHGEDVAIN